MRYSLLKFVINISNIYIFKIIYFTIHSSILNSNNFEYYFRQVPADDSKNIKYNTGILFREETTGKIQIRKIKLTKKIFKNLHFTHWCIIFEQLFK